MSETRMEQKTDIPALREALAKSTPGEARLLPNGAAGLDEDPTYWGVLGGDGYYDGPGSGFNLTGFIGEAEVQRIVLSYNALPALLDELEALRRLTTPEVIGEKHKRGDTWLCYFPESYGWSRVYWSERWQHWQSPDGAYLLGTPTHALPMPGEPEGKP